VSHLTTTTGDPLEIGEVTAIPQSEDTDSRCYSDFARVPAAGEVFRPEPPFVYDRPHSLLAARGMGRDPFDIEHAIAAKVDRFLLLVRLVHSATAQSYYGSRRSKRRPLPTGWRMKPGSDRQSSGATSAAASMAAPTVG
jgi:hypothetical protein